MSKPLVIFHDQCMDGFAASWAFHRKHPDADFHPAKYGDAPPDVAGRDVYIADFSYPRTVMLDICRAARRVVVLDHHKTAQKELLGLHRECLSLGLEMPYVMFDMDKSGARLAWEFCFPEEEAPWVIQYVEARDLWKLDSLPNVREVSAWLRSHDFGFDDWDVLFGNGPPGGKQLDGWVGDGWAILRAEKKVVDSHVRNARTVNVGGHSVLGVNATTLFSEIAGELAKGRPFGVAWFVRADGLVQLSLRSDEGGLDVSEVARALGGGGHAHAAGAEIEMHGLARMIGQ